MKYKTPASIAHWLPLAAALPAETVKVSAPIHVLIGEAADLSKFVVKYWHPVKDSHTGAIRRPGLKQAGGAEHGLDAHTGAELLSLGEAVQHAQTAYLIAAGHEGTPDLVARADYLLGELTATLEWFFDDGVEDANDAALASVQAEHHNDPHTQDALASALDDYAGLAEPHAKELDGLGGFDSKLIPEARAVAKQLRDKPAQAAADTARTEEARNALDARNRLATLLAQRMTRVRNGAKFVFRNHPDIAREASSAYERRKRAETRRKKKQKEAGAAK